MENKMIIFWKKPRFIVFFRQRDKRLLKYDLNRSILNYMGPQAKRILQPGKAAIYSFMIFFAVWGLHIVIP